MMRAILCLALSAAAFPAMAQPHMTKAPTQAQVLAVYPKAAMDRRASGVATMRCTVLTTGLLADCVALGEHPAGLGFSQAVLKLQPTFEYAPEMANGAAAAVQTEVEVRFDPPAQSFAHRYGVRILVLGAWAAVVVAFVVRRRRHRQTLTTST